ncbi:DUF6441 family protein [Burkholderia multivorans]|uniref:DUF6441 family protein n=1 Tax=Burkholderia multivorans TaxID=87883 RepID=UPI000D01054E|nr:DUF6441 family protein [Burkholderia multivorans]PRE26220.1 hypothetical protein C6P92_05225 [Burkholderia multivorans]PRF94821.1 hypothetical protein C6Q22_02080 [Burkholderia multivorans]
MKIALFAEGLLDRRRFNAWQADSHKAIHSAVARAMRDSGKEMAERVRGEMRSSFNAVKPKFLRSMHAKVFDRKATEFPALYIGSKVPWLGLHEQGGTIRGRMLIPLLPQHRRIGRKAFARVIDALMRSGNAWFVEKNGQQILMAENIGENARPLTRFRRAERERTGAKRLKRGHEIPVAVLVRRVTLRKRFDLTRSVRVDLPRLTAAIRKAMSKV